MEKADGEPPRPLESKDVSYVSLCPPVCRAEPGVNHGPGEDQGRREWSAQSYVWKVSVRHVVAATSHPMADLMFHSFFSSQPASGLMWELPLLPRGNSPSSLSGSAPRPGIIAWHSGLSLSLLPSLGGEACSVFPGRGLRLGDLEIISKYIAYVLP